ncbi:MAG: ABC transporter substrate-binding protein [Spirochaetaceae bacterium]|jgi:iron complex transport system substrate-binding protein|nr:ABC transporter substrate-binding protein [Spirochaetaceae bacterium]
MRIISFLAILLITSVTAYAKGKTEADPAKSGGSAAKTIAIRDDSNRSVSITLPVQRVALLDSGLGTALSALGVLDRVVGTHQALQNSLFGGIKDVPMIATYASINYEALVETTPQLVLSATSHHGYVSESDHLDEFGIQFVALDLRTPSRMRNDIRILGQIFEREAQAQKVIDFYDKYQQIIDSRLARVPESGRPRVFLEMHAGPFHTGSPQSQFYQQVELAGGINIARELADNPLSDDIEVSSEWVVKKDPDYIVREVSALRYTEKDTNAIKPMYDEIIARPGFDALKAVKNRKIFLIGNDIHSRPGYIVGVCYLAKEFYPDLFKDLDPEAVHREWFALAYPGIPLAGIWTYSE